MMKAWSSYKGSKMKLPAETELRDYFAVAHGSAAERMQWYFDRFWLEVAEQHGYAYPAEFPEGSALAEAHNAAHEQLVADLARLTHAEEV